MNMLYRQLKQRFDLSHSRSGIVTALLTDDMNHKGGENYEPAPATVRRGDGEASSPLSLNNNGRLLPRWRGFHWNLLCVEVQTDWLLFIRSRHPRTPSLSPSDPPSHHSSQRRLLFTFKISLSVLLTDKISRTQFSSFLR